MASRTEVAGAIGRVLTEVAPAVERTTGFVRRRSKLTGAVFVQTLVLTWLGRPDASLGELVQTASELGVTISPQGLAERFTDRASLLLEEVLGAAAAEVIAAAPAALPILRRFSRVTVQDSTTIALPAELAEYWRGCGGTTPEGEAALKLQVRLDLLGGQLEGPLLEDGRAADPRTPLQTAPQPAGTLRLQDLGSFRLDLLADLASQGVFWLTRMLVNTTILTPDGEPLDLAEALPQETGVTQDRPVLLGVKERLPARLLAVRVPQEVADERRRKLRAEARWAGLNRYSDRRRPCVSRQLVGSLAAAHSGAWSVTARTANRTASQTSSSVLSSATAPSTASASVRCRCVRSSPSRRTSSKIASKTRRSAPCSRSRRRK